MDSQPPNLLYIHSDQHAQRVLDCYGDSFLQNTNLSRLAKSGIVFDNIYCDSPICVPSRMSMLTARRPFENEVWTNEQQLDSRTPTLAHSFGAAGYDPVLIGRMHAMGPDQLRGYSRRLVGDHCPNQLGGPAIDRGSLEGTAGPHRISLKKSGAGQSAYQVHDEEVQKEAVAFLQNACNQRQSGSPSKPFNLTVGYMLPHPPYVARYEDFERFRSKMTLPAKQKESNTETHPFLQWWRSHTEIETVPIEEQIRARAAYWALVYRLDQWIGELLQILEDAGQLENTLVVYTSDHGDMLGEHGLWWKHTFYEESVKVPLIMSWPGHMPRNTRSSLVASGVDVTATILELLGAPPLPGMSGRSFASQLHDPGRSKWDDLAFSEYSSTLFAPGEGCYQRMVRKEEWKYIYFHGQPDMLFNLARDPAELENLAEDPLLANTVSELKSILMADWSPDLVSRKMEELGSVNSLLEKWGENTQVQDTIRWQLEPGMNFLDSR